MSKVESPYPALEPDAERLPAARWWRIVSRGRNADGHLYTVSHNGGLSQDGSLRWPGATYVTVEWFDGRSAVFDAGWDSINTAGLVIEGRDMYVLVDLLMEFQPTPDAVPMTSPGDRQHPNDIGIRTGR